MHIIHDTSITMYLHGVHMGTAIFVYVSGS